ncbi:MAG: hypothetical protein ACRDLP_04835 [Solirubrobacteraceae bacterium]
MLFKLLRGLIDAVEGATRLLFGGARRLVDMLERRSGGARDTSEPGDGP